MDAADPLDALAGELRERLLAAARAAPDGRGPPPPARELVDAQAGAPAAPALALDGPALTIRRFRPRGLGPDDLVAAGTLQRPLLEFLARAVRARCTLLVCGGTGSGKTTTLNALSEFIGAGERIVTIEDA